MKVLVVIAVLLFVGWQVDARAIKHPEHLSENVEACITELNLDINKLAAVGMRQPYPENNDDFTKLMSCTGKKKGHITSNGHINYQVIKNGMLDDLKSQIPSNMFASFQQTATVVFLNCQQNLPTETDPGLAYIKALNCITTGMNRGNR